MESGSFVPESLGSHDLLYLRPLNVPRPSFPALDLHSDVDKLGESTKVDLFEIGLTLSHYSSIKA